MTPLETFGWALIGFGCGGLAASMLLWAIGEKRLARLKCRLRGHSWREAGTLFIDDGINRRGAYWFCQRCSLTEER